MWKKLGVTLIALLSTFSVVYAMNRDMFAAGTIYNAGGDVTGRVNMAPSNLVTSGSTLPSDIGMQKGDKVFIGDTTDIGFQLIEFNKDYSLVLFDEATETFSAETATTKYNAWFSMAVNSLATVNLLEVSDLTTVDPITNDKKSNFINSNYAVAAYVLPYNHTNVKREIDTFNNDQLHIANSKKIIAPRNLARDKKYYDLAGTHVHYKMHMKYNISGLTGKKAFTIAPFSYTNFSASGATVPSDVLSSKDLAWSNKYHAPFLQSNNDSGTEMAFAYIQPTGALNLLTIGSYSDDASDSASDIYNGNLNLSVRPAIYLDMTDVVFAVSHGSNSEIAKILEPVLPSEYTSIFDETKKYANMKLRMFDSSMNATLTDIRKNNISITQVAENNKVNLIADANIGADYIVSALVFDGTTNEFLYYKPLEPAKGSGSYEFDTGGIPIGKYKIAIVNEAYNEKDNSPANCSEISQAFNLEISKMHDMTYTQTPQAGTPGTTMSYFEEGINTSSKIQVATALAKVEEKDGTISIPTYPVNYEIIGTTDASDTNWQNLQFRKDTNGKYVKDGDNYIIEAKNNLPVGVYNFRIKAYDDGHGPLDESGAYGIDKDGNAVVDVDYGLISDVQMIIVYPSSDTIKFKAEKKTVDNVEKNLNTSDINDAGATKTIGTASLEPDPKASPSPAFDSSMAITYAIKDVKLNGVSIRSGSEDFQVDPNTGIFSKKGNISYGKHEFTLSVTYTKDNKAITIDKKDCSFYIDPVIYFVDPLDNSKKITELSVKHDESASIHDFTVLAKSDSSEVSGSVNLNYRVKKNDTSGKIVYKNKLNQLGNFTTAKPGITIIEAYYAENGIDIVVSELEVTVTVDALEKLKFMEAPQKDTAGKAMTYFSYQENVAKDQIIGKISSNKGANPITYILSDKTNFYLKDNPDAQTQATQKYVTDSDGNVLVYAKKDLQIGKYALEIQAYDANNEPYFSEDDGVTKYGIDANGNKVVEHDKGLISVTYDIVVYPNETQYTLTQANKTVDSHKEFYTDKDINDDLNTILATIEFDSSAKISDLDSAGYIIDTVSLMNKGTTTPFAGLKVEKDPTNNNKFYIKADGNVTSGTKEFDILVNFKKAGTTLISAKVKKETQSIYIPGELNYINPDKSTEFLNGSEYLKQYDPVTSLNNSFYLSASESITVKNVNVKYCIVKDDACNYSASTIVDISHANGTATITAKAPGMVNKDVIIRAYTEDAKGVLQTKKDIKIIIQPATQTLSWTGEDIQTSNNDVVKDELITSSTGQPTWQLKIKYEEQTNPVTPGLNEYSLVKAYDKTSISKGTIGIRSNVLEDTTTPNSPLLDIEYEVIYDLPTDDSGKINEDELKKGKLIINGELKGNATIIATAKATGNYAATINKDDTNTAVVETIGSATLKLNVSTRPKVEYVASSSANIISGDALAKGTSSLGTLSLDNNDASYTYRISKAEVFNKVATDAAKKNDPLAKDVYDSYLTTNFIIKDNVTATLKDQLYVNRTTLPSGLPKGTYRVTISASKTVNGIQEEAIPKVITIIVDDKVMDISKLKWQSKDDKVDAIFNDTNGLIAEEPVSKEFVNNKTLSKTYYQDANGNDGFFYVKVADTDNTELTGASITYEEVSGTGAESIINVDSTGKVTMLSASPKDVIVRVKATIRKSGYADRIVYLPIVIEKGESNFKFVNQAGLPYTIKTSPSNKSDPYVYEALLNLNSTPKSAYVFEKDKKLDVVTANAPDNTKVTISIVDKGASMGNDVLSFNDTDPYVQSNTDTATKVCEISATDYATNRTSGCLVQIEHALNKYKGTNSDLNKIILVAEVAESSNYIAKRLEMPINIMPAKQEDFDFKETTLPLDSVSDPTSVTPVFKEVTSSSKIGDGKITLYTTNPDDENDVVDSEILRLGDPNAGAMGTYTKGIDSIVYDILVGKDDPEDSKTVYIYAIKEASRDYLASDVKKQALEIAKEGQSRIRIDLYAYAKADDDVDTQFKTSITYGDAYFRMEASADTDEDDTPTYTYTIDPSSSEFLEIYGTNGDEFKALKAGSAYVNVTRKANGQTDINRKYMVTIGKRPVKLKIQDVSKKSGMSVDASVDYAFTSDSINFLADDLKDLEIAFSCQDSDAVEVDTLSDGVRMLHNNLPIHATITNKVSTKDMLSNYKITYLDGKTAGVEDGKLIVSEDKSSKTWYEVKEGSQIDIDGNSIATLKGMNNWYNGNVDVILKSAAGDYDLIGDNFNTKSWSNTKFTVNKEGINTTNIYFRKSAGSEKDAISEPQIETIKIDKVAPIVTEIKATLTHTDSFAKLINAITFGTFMKPGEEVSIKTEDVQVDKKVEVSSTKSVIDGIQYKVYELDSNGNRGNVYVANTIEDTDSNGNFVFNLDDPGTYEVCVIVKDQAGNASAEKCEKLLVKKIGIDIDHDGEKEFIDSNNDGCPDIDILLKDKDNKDYKLNVDLNDDGIPDMNIDSSGDTAGSPPDGIAEINVDTDDDGKPDLNLVILDKWEPNFCVTDQSETYCTMKNIEAIINVDTDHDGIPDINIDTDGDMKADINIDTNENGILDRADSNITSKLEEWKPKDMQTSGSFEYGTMDKLKAYVNVIVKGDTHPSLNIDTDGDGLPDLNIDSDGDGIPETNIDGNGDGEADINVDIGNDGTPDENILVIREWKPGILVDGKVPYKTMDIKYEEKEELEDNGIVIRPKDPEGTFLPNYALKVDDVTSSLSDKDKSDITNIAGKDSEVKIVYDVSLTKDGVVVQPDGSIEVRIPVDTTIKNPKVLMQDEDGSWKLVDAKIDGDFFVFETDYIGSVSVIGDKAVDTKDPSSPSDSNNPSDQNPSVNLPTVKGDYTGGVGGAGTGDKTDIIGYIIPASISLCIILYIFNKRKKKASKYF